MKKFDAEKAHENHHYENFCQFYSGDFWGDKLGAYKRSGFAKKKDDEAAKEAADLLMKKEIIERIKYLRLRKLNEIADQLWVAQERKKIIENAEKESERLAALKDLEKGLGLSNDPKECNPGINVEIVFNKKDGTF